MRYRPARRQPFERTLTGPLLIAGALTVLAVTAASLAVSGALRGLGL